MDAPLITSMLPLQNRFRNHKAALNHRDSPENLAALNELRNLGLVQGKTEISIAIRVGGFGSRLPSYQEHLERLEIEGRALNGVLPRT